MQTINKIVISDTEPNKEDLWINRGVLRYFGPKGWEIPLDLESLMEILKDTVITLSCGITASYFFRASDTTSDSNLAYIGYSADGTETSSNDWDIKKYDNTTGLLTMAKGSWDNRLTLNYV